MTVKKDVSEHRHCNACGKPVPLDESFCSEECAGKLMQARKKQQRSTFIFMGVVFLAVLLYMFFGVSRALPTPPTP